MRLLFVMIEKVSTVNFQSGLGLGIAKALLHPQPYRWFALTNKKGTAFAVPFDQVVFMNFSRHLGQVMEILPFPFGTLTC